MGAIAELFSGALPSFLPSTAAAGRAHRGQGARPAAPTGPPPCARRVVVQRRVDQGMQTGRALRSALHAGARRRQAGRRRGIDGLESRHRGASLDHRRDRRPRMVRQGHDARRHDPGDWHRRRQSAALFTRGRGGNWSSDCCLAGPSIDFQSGCTSIPVRVHPNRRTASNWRRN